MQILSFAHFFPRTKSFLLCETLPLADFLHAIIFAYPFSLHATKALSQPHFTAEIEHEFM